MILAQLLTALMLASPAHAGGTTAIGRALSSATDTVGSVPLDGTKVTYSTSTVGLVTALTATDVFTITGSASKTVRVTRIEISGTETTGALRDVLLLKRSTANSGGTSSTYGGGKHDSNDASATATVQAYTANPTTLGTLVATMRAAKFAFPATNLSSASNTLVWTFGDRPGKAIVLRGTGEVLAVNLNATTLAGSSLDITVEWTEE